MMIKTKVEDLMAKDVFSVDIDDTIKKADDIMHQEHIKQVPVLESGKLVGIITERKVMEYGLKKLYDSEEPLGENALNTILDFEKIMTKNYHHIYPEDSINKAVELMAKKKVDFLPVVDWENNLVGLITNHDIMMFIHKNFVDGKL